MKIVQFTAENIKKLKIVDITPTKDFIQVTGKNGSGKTSVLDSIWWALAGGKAIQGEPIRKGEEKAQIRLDLGEMVVTRRFSKSGTTLVIENADGFRASKPQEMLDAIIGHLTFDPLEFSRMNPRQQFDVLRGIAEVDVDIDAIAAKDKIDTEKRRDINRDIKMLEGQVAGISVPENVPEQPVNVADLMKKLTELEDHNSLLREHEIEGENHKTLVLKAKARIADLKVEMLQAFKTLDELEEKIYSGVIYHSTDEIKAQISGAHEINKAFESNQRKGQLNAQIALKTKESDGITDAMERRKVSLAESTAKAKMPLDGLELGNGEVKFNGVPLLQLSSAEQLKVSCAIAMEANPKLRIIRIKDGSLLDDESLKFIQASAAEHDYQVWVERVDTSGKIGIVMEDGEIKATNEDAA